MWFDLSSVVSILVCVYNIFKLTKPASNAHTSMILNLWPDRQNHLFCQPNVHQSQLCYTNTQLEWCKLYVQTTPALCENANDIQTHTHTCTAISFLSFTPCVCVLTYFRVCFCICIRMNRQNQTKAKVTRYKQTNERMNAEKKYSRPRIVSIEQYKHMYIILAHSTLSQPFNWLGFVHTKSLWLLLFSASKKKQRFNISIYCFVCIAFLRLLLLLVCLGLLCSFEVDHYTCMEVITAHLLFTMLMSKKVNTLIYSINVNNNRAFYS